MILSCPFKDMVSPQAVPTDERVRTTGGEEEEVHVGCGLQVTGYELQVPSYGLTSYWVHWVHWVH